MPLSEPSAPAVLAALPRALSLAAAAVAAATASLLLISAVFSTPHHAASSSSPQLPPSASASTAAPLAPAPAHAPDSGPGHPHPLPPVPPCPPNATHDVPCHEPPSRERHCPPRPPPPPPLLPHPPKDPPPHPPPHCRVPPPPRYRPPPPWPARRDRARYANVDLPPLPPVKAADGQQQDPVHGRGEWLLFTDGVQGYVERLERVVPLRDGVVHTALDIGCGVASFGDYLLNYGVLTMSIAPRDRFEPQVQLALERGLPAMIGALVAHRLPYPSRSFDMVHCADCRVPWTAHGMRIFRQYNLAKYNFCYGAAETFNGCAGGAMKKWPKRLGAVPPRIASGEIEWLSIQRYRYDTLVWEKRVNFYLTYLNFLSNGTYRNVMDMSAGSGGFAAAMSKHPVWVMNVVPANTTENALGVIYERGLIGTYTDWCEAFSTYPRTYDLIHGNGIFSSHIHKCGIIDILVEMDRILRPGGAVIVRDRADVVLRVKKDADRLRWHSRVVDTENGPLDPEKLLIVDNSLPLPGS
ncbi:putative methyltransferase PMT19 [Zea mays]|uniref:Methyltransferase n=1 Tax=Zea mays TaxID=4577 RepID=A0A3L6FCM8_MAIZE|nr:putative methyltransferase PMT19 [Zea mays]